MAQTRILRSLYLLITEKQEDDELVLQILFALYRFLQVRYLAITPSSAASCRYVT